MAFYRFYRRAYAAIYLNDKSPCDGGARADLFAVVGKVIDVSGFGGLALPNHVKRQI